MVPGRVSTEYVTAAELPVSSITTWSAVLATQTTAMAAWRALAGLRTPPKINTEPSPVASDTWMVFDADAEIVSPRPSPG